MKHFMILLQYIFHLLGIIIASVGFYLDDMCCIAYGGVVAVVCLMHAGIERNSEGI